jgi:hypothetical protein
VSTPRARITVVAALLAGAALPATAGAQDRSPWLPPPGLAPQPAWQRVEPRPPRSPLPPLLTRTLSLPAGMMTLQWGAGYAYSALPGTGFGRSDIGLGVSFDLSAGLGKHLQLDFGTGLRLGSLVAADRYGRVFRDEVFQTGNRFVGNPWVKLRYAFLDGPDRAVGVGVEALLQAPLAEASAWSIGFGVPVQFVLRGARLRVEGGLYFQAMLSNGSSTRNVLSVPVRVLFTFTERFAVGLVTGMQMGNAFLDNASEAHVQLGLALRGRVGDSVELSGQWLLPAASPAGLDAYGLGFAVTHRVR